MSPLYVIILYMQAYEVTYVSFTAYVENVKESVGKSAKGLQLLLICCAYFFRLQKHSYLTQEEPLACLSCLLVRNFADRLVGEAVFA